MKNITLYLFLFLFLFISCNKKTDKNKIIELNNTIKNKLNIKKNTDNDIQLIKYDIKFKNTSLYKSLQKLQGIRIYVLLMFFNKINYKQINKIRYFGFNTRNQLITDCLEKKQLIFYGKYKFLEKLLKLNFIDKIYILNKYTAKGYYKINFKTEDKKNNISFNIYLPYSKKGKKLIYQKTYLSGNFNIIRKYKTNNLLVLNIDSYGKPIKIFSYIKYSVDLSFLLNYHIMIAGDIELSEYIAEMKNEHTSVFNTYTKSSEKIIFNSFVSNISDKLKKYNLISDKYRILTTILNENIQYDYKKKKLFFSGNLVYTNISDMYLNTINLTETKKGACPDRSSLEAAVLRLNKIATRISTRAGHIYIEIFIPSKGWVTTSLTLNEVPLCYSSDEKQSYFISWSPVYPVRILKWESILYPDSNLILRNTDE